MNASEREDQEMRIADMPVGTVVTLRGWRTVPNTLRVAKVVTHESFAVEVEYLYGEDLPMHMIEVVDGGPRTESPAKGEIRRVKLGDVLRVATPEDHSQEEFEWDEIARGIAAVIQLKAHNYDAIILPQWPMQIQVKYTMTQAEGIAEAARNAMRQTGRLP